MNTDERLDDRVLYRGRKIDLALRPVPMADGTIVEREVVIHRGAVALLPILEGGRICLVRNRRYAVGRHLLEIPAGTIEPGESPDACASRELAEETGYRADRITLLTSWWVSPGLFTEQMHLFLCEGLRPGPPAPEADEDLELIETSLYESLTMIGDGRIDDAKTMLALLLWERLRPSPPG